MNFESPVTIVNGPLHYAPSGPTAGWLVMAVLSGECVLCTEQTEHRAPPCTALFVRTDQTTLIESSHTQAVIWHPECGPATSVSPVNPLPLSELDAAVIHDVFFEHTTSAAHQQAALRFLTYQLLERPHSAAASPNRVPADSSAMTLHTYLLAHLDDTPSLDHMAQVFQCSKAHLVRRCRQATGQSPMQYLAELRFMRAKELLLRSDLTIAHIAHAIGYASPAAFTHFFQRHAHMSPRDYRANCQWLV